MKALRWYCKECKSTFRNPHKNHRHYFGKVWYRCPKCGSNNYVPRKE